MRPISKSLFILMLFNFFISNSASSQESLKISGLIIDTNTELPIPYTNIGIKNKFLGTVSDQSGYFYLELSSFTDSDTVELSRMGYEKIKIPVREMTDSDASPKVIAIRQNMMDLEEFVISAEYVNGNKSFGSLTSKSRFAYAFNPTKSNARANLGRELGIEIDPKDLAIRLSSISFILQSNQLDQITFRINIYKEDTEEIGSPGEKIFEKLYEIAEKGRSTYSISVENEEIVLKEKLWVCIEFVDFQSENEFGVVTVPVKFPFGKYHFRESSLGEWKSVMGNPSIKVDVEVLK